MSGKENETREILFRGRMPQTRKWAYGCLLYWAEKAQIWEYDEYGATHNYIVDSETVGQYTGLDDKNGVKIFKGDVVKSDNGSVGDVQFSHGVFGVEWVSNKQNRDMVGGWGQLHNLRKLDDGLNAKMRIIGNIHDNPELLEEKE
jgi:uncharacterized phage protein (TIGR01671 family)